MIQTLREWFSGRNKLHWLVAIGLIGMVLIGLSEWRNKTPTEHRDDGSVSAQQVEEALERRITTLLSHVEGVGDCYVMVTLEQGVQQVYASEKSSGSESVLTVSTDSGPVGLLITEIQPIIKGVVVVCDGGGDSEVRERVTAAVATAFNLSTRRVYVLI